MANSGAAMLGAGVEGGAPEPARSPWTPTNSIRAEDPDTLVLSGGADQRVYGPGVEARGDTAGGPTNAEEQAPPAAKPKGKSRRRSVRKSIAKASGMHHAFSKVRA
jgi:hypothetical protein